MPIVLKSGSLNLLEHSGAVQACKEIALPLCMCVDADEKGPYILRSEVEKAIKEMRNKKATEDDDVPGDVFKLLGEGCLKIMRKLINTFMKLESGPRTSRKLQ